MFKILFSYKSIILIYIHVSDIDIVLLFCCDHFYDFVIKEFLAIRRAISLNKTFVLFC